MIVLLGSARSSPGVTTATLALAGAIAGPVLVVEASRDAGVIAPRFGLRHEPGVTSLVAETRHGDQPVAVERHTQGVPGTSGRVSVLAGPSSHDAAAMAVAAVADRLATLLNGLETVVLVDAGRLDATAPTLRLVRQVDRVLLVVRPRPEEAQAVVNLLPVVGDAGGEPLLLVRGDRPYHPKEFAATLGVGLAGVLPDDPRAAAGLAGVATTHGVARSALLKAAGRITDRLVADMRDEQAQRVASGAEVVS